MAPCTPRPPRAGKLPLAALAHSERHLDGWEIHYRLEPASEKYAGVARIQCDGMPPCELSIFEPQPNALASIDLLREQCLAWIERRAEAVAPAPAASAGQPAS